MTTARVRTMRVDFYQALVNDGNGKLEELIRKASGEPGEQRAKTTEDRTIRLQDGVVAGRWIQGELLRVDMFNIPMKAKKDGTIEEIELDDDQGIGNTAAFMFEPLRCIVALERNRLGPSRRAFEEYFEQFGADRVELLPIASRQMWRQIESMTQIRKVTVRFASTKAENIFGEDDDAIADSLDMANEFQAPMVEVQLSMGRQRGGLEKSKSVSWLKRILSAVKTKGSEVEKLVVEGRRGDEPGSIVDLMAFHLTYSEEVRLDHRRQAALSDRVKIIKSGLRSHKDELESVIPPEPSS